MKISTKTILRLPLIAGAASGKQLRGQAATEDGNMAPVFSTPEAAAREAIRKLSEPNYDYQGISGFRTIMISKDRSGGKYDSTLLSGESKTAYHRTCKLELTPKGSLVTYRKNKKGNYYKLWESGNFGDVEGEYQTTLGGDGNLVTKDIATGETIWSTRSQDPEGSDWVCGPAQYYLFFGNGGSTYYHNTFGRDYDLCDLSIWKYKPGCPVPGEEDSWYGDSFGRWWGNEHSISAENIYNNWNPLFSTLQKGEIAYSDPYTMTLDKNCNLIVYEGFKFSQQRNIVWSSEEDGAEPVDPDGDCHLFARRRDPENPDSYGELVLYKNSLKRGITNSIDDRGVRYWSRRVDCDREEDGTYDVGVTKDGPVGSTWSC